MNGDTHTIYRVQQEFRKTDTLSAMGSIEGWTTVTGSFYLAGSLRFIFNYVIFIYEDEMPFYLSLKSTPQLCHDRHTAPWFIDYHVIAAQQYKTWDGHKLIRTTVFLAWQVI